MSDQVELAQLTPSGSTGASAFAGMNHSERPSPCRLRSSIPYSCFARLTRSSSLKDGKRTPGPLRTA